MSMIPFIPSDQKGSATSAATAASILTLARSGWTLLPGESRKLAMEYDRLAREHARLTEEAAQLRVALRLTEGGSVDG